MWIFDASHPRALAQCLKLKDRITTFKTAEQNLCVLNKVDKIAKETLLPLIQSVFELGIFSEIIPISAKKGDGADRLVNWIKARLPEGMPYFPTDMVTDRTEQFLVSELVREKIYEATKQEIPYSAWVEIEGWENPDETRRFPTIRAIIHVDSSSRKGIMIGKGGEMLKRIGMAARQEVEARMGTQVVLKLYVDVEESWKNDPNMLNRVLGIDLRITSRCPCLPSRLSEGPMWANRAFFNALLGYRRTIVLDLPGTTMDSVSERVKWCADPLNLIDSQGIHSEKDQPVLDSLLSKADAVLFIVDGMVGVTPFDRWIASEVRLARKPTLLCVNKTESKSVEGVVD